MQCLAPSLAVTIFVGICVVVVVVALIFVVADGVSVFAVFVLSFFWRGVSFSHIQFNW